MPRRAASPLIEADDTAITPDYANGETDVLLNGKPYRRFQRTCPPGELVACIAVACDTCKKVQHLYGTPDIGKVQGEKQFRDEGWSSVEVPHTRVPHIPRYEPRPRVYVCARCAERRKQDRRYGYRRIPVEGPRER